MIQKHITWQGIENDTIEYCVVTWGKDKITVVSTIEGIVEGKKIKLDYELLLDQDWQVKGFDIKSHVGDKKAHYQYTTTGVGQWYDENQVLRFEGCTDIDITLTPLTNTLPIKRLRWQPHETKLITVLYVDVMNNILRRDEQSYTQLSDLAFQFENDNGRFRAKLEIDQTGFVLSYPELFEMKKSF